MSGLTIAETAPLPPTPSSWRLIALVLEGYAYIALVVGTLIGAPALLVWGLLSRKPFVGLIAVLIGVPLLLVAITAVRALLFRISPPDGVRVSRAEAPELHAEVEKIRHAVGAPHVHEIVIIGHFNASAMQLPRFGVFWPRNYLLLGYPLFGVMSPDQMRAVIAHELAHLSRAHGQLASLVHRLRLSWGRLLQALDTSTPTFALFLLRRYAPRLTAHSLALARRHELAVDQIAARVAGAGPAAESIVALGVVGSIYDEMLWSEVERDEGDGPGPYSRAQPDVWRVVASEGETRLETLLAETTGDRDTHPAVAERLRNMGATPRVPGRPDRTAGEVWLGSSAAAIAMRLDKQWLASQGASWNEDRTERRESRARLRELEQLADLTPTQRYEKAELVESLDGLEAAFSLYEEAASHGSPNGELAMGAILLERNDERGVALIEQAIADDESLGSHGYSRIADFLEGRGQRVEANRYATMARAAATRASLAATERRELSSVDRFEPHGLDDHSLARIAAALAQTPKVHSALLVKKAFRHSVGARLILAMNGDASAPSIRDRLLSDRILAEHGDSDVVVLGRFDGALRQSLNAVPGAAIYPRA